MRLTTLRQERGAIQAAVEGGQTGLTGCGAAPEPLIPNNCYGSGADALNHFEESRAKTIAFLREAKDLRAHALDSPLGQKLDAYQWLLFIAAHSDRHTKQILEVKADPGFPKN